MCLSSLYDLSQINLGLMGHLEVAGLIQCVHPFLGYFSVLVPILPFGLDSYASDHDHVTTFNLTKYRRSHFTVIDRVL